MPFTITLRGREITIDRKMLPQVDLRFYRDNPRVYSIVRQQEGDEPDQDDILEALARMDHVKQLVQAIRQNGGLTDPLLVRGSDNAVIEGNSRLAAYRILARGNAVSWGMVKCDVVADIDDLEIRTLLAHYHIIGRKSWDPFEQAGMFWRWHKEGLSLKDISEKVEEIGISSKKIQHWIKVYSLMVRSKDTDPSRWSYYDELVKSRQIQRLCEQNPAFTDVVVRKIKSGEIKKAVDVRNKVTKIAQAGGKVVKTFMTKGGSLDSCYERAVDGGATDVLYNKMRRFREAIADPDSKRGIQSMSNELRKKCQFELSRIKNAVERLLDTIHEG